MSDEQAVEEAVEKPFYALATRQRLPLRIAIDGPSGSGKTLSALLLAKGIVGAVDHTSPEWGNVYVANTDPDANILGYVESERFGVGQPNYVSIETPYRVERVIEAGVHAVNANAQVLIIDSMSAFWDGEGGLRSEHDLMPGDTWQNWAKVNPRWNNMIDFLTRRMPIHIICLMKSKTDRTLEKVPGQKSKLVTHGLTPVMRPGTEYNFTLYFSLQMDHSAQILTQRTDLFSPEEVSGITLSSSVGQRLSEWADFGEEGIQAEKMNLDWERITAAGRERALNPKQRVAKRQAAEKGWAPTASFSGSSKGSGQNGGKVSNVAVEIVNMDGAKFWPVVYGLAHNTKTPRAKMKNLVVEVANEVGKDGAKILATLLKNHWKGGGEKTYLGLNTTTSLDLYEAITEHITAPDEDSISREPVEESA